MRIPFASRLIIVCTIIGILPLGIGVAFYSQRLQDFLYKNSTIQSADRVNYISQRLQQHVGAIIESLQVAQKRVIVNAANDQSILEWLYDQYSQIDSLIVTDKEDLVSSSVMRYSFISRGKKYHQDNFAAAEEMSISFVEWNLEPQIEVSLPIEDLFEGELIGVLHTRIRIQRLLNELITLREDKGVVFVVNDQADLVAHPDNNEVIKGVVLRDNPLVQQLLQGSSSAQANYINRHGIEVSGYGTKVHNLPLFVLQEQPIAEVFRLSNDFLRHTLLIVVVVFVLLFVTSVFVARKITLPLRKLEQGTRMVQGGDLQHRIEIPKQRYPDEFHALSECFNSMVETLAMDNAYRERTKEELSQRADELHKLQSYLHNVIDSMPSMLIGVDKSGYITQWNSEAQRSYGSTAEQMVGKLLYQQLPDLGITADQLQNAISQRQPQTLNRLEYEQEGHTRFRDITIYPLVANGVEGVVIRIDDVTEQVRIAEMMVQSEKMLSVGGLAAGMAHEINNPLAGILQNLQVMQNRFSPTMAKNRRVAEGIGFTMEQLHQYMQQRGILEMIDSVMESGQRAAKIVANMLSFSRKNSGNRTATNVAELLDKTVELAANDFNLKKKYDFRQIIIERNYQANLAMGHCEPNQLQQVLLNLLKNGAQAMAESNSERAAKFTLQLYNDAQWLYIEISDNGPGMDEQTRKRIFEPFFTTKAVGVGTGLGLSVSYFIITENHHGKMWVKSELGVGTTFVIQLPLQQK